jgi:hypothetical protein
MLRIGIIGSVVYMSIIILIGYIIPALAIYDFAKKRFINQLNFSKPLSVGFSILIILAYGILINFFVFHWG